MSEVVLHIANVGKCYRTYSSFTSRVCSWFGKHVDPSSEYWAVREISFDLRAGEVLGLIGQNGAGKSTLLKLVTGTVRPTVGEISVQGRVSAILELGLGFNPDFTGRHNVFFAAGLMGLSDGEINSIISDIEDFAELGEFFDQPLRVYSSGMQGRLAFAVATAVRPDVLIVDEVLSVGDSYFQHKSFDRIRKFKEQGTSILFVTHGMDSVMELCDRVMLLDKGCSLKTGLPDEVVDYYNAMMAEKENSKLTIEQRRQKDGWLQTRSGTFDVRMQHIELFDADSQKSVATVRVGQRLALKLDAKIYKDTPKLVLGYMLRNKMGHVVWGTNTWHTKQIVENLREGEEVQFVLSFTCDLGPGSYSFSPALVSSDTHLENNYEWVDNALVFDVINTDKLYFIGTSYLDAEFIVHETRMEVK